ncbi:MAG: pantothenate synthetase [Bacteroidia bacterium]|nr:MAG: pantothenate synthetase [Bacteroidia bacterium]
MKVLGEIKEIRRFIKNIKQKNTKVAFVPTMGALHEGHLELLKTAKNYADFVVLSIYVNPTQFGKNEDFDKYPRNLEKDLLTIQNHNLSIDVVFAPSNQEMYPFSESPSLTFPSLSQKLCGISRPTHFDGVGLIVLKLLNIIQPDYLIMGQKDFQQTVIIQRLIDEFFFDIQLIVVPTVREKDGLALSSRNMYLSPQERQQALILYQTLNSGKKTTSYRYALRRNSRNFKRS